MEKVPGWRRWWPTLLTVAVVVVVGSCQADQMARDRAARLAFECEVRARLEELAERPGNR